MKLSMLLTAAGLSAAMTSGQIFAQDIKNQTDLAGTTPVKTQTASPALPDAPATGTAAASTINLHAIKDFKFRFENVKDERWYVLDKGFLAYFSMDGYHKRVYYDSKGRWQASLTYADEHRLPAFIREIVRRAYYDLPITYVTIIEVPEHTVYQVMVEDKANLKVLRVSEDGELDVITELKKL